MTQRVSDDRLAGMVRLSEMPRQRGHEPNKVTYQGADAHALVFDLRDARAEVARLKAERPALRGEGYQPGSEPSTPVPPQGGSVLAMPERWYSEETMAAVVKERDALKSERDTWKKACENMLPAETQRQLEHERDALTARVTALVEALDMSQCPDDCGDNQGACNCLRGRVLEGMPTLKSDRLALVERAVKVGVDAARHYDSGHHESYNPSSIAGRESIAARVLAEFDKEDGK